MLLSSGEVVVLTILGNLMTLNTIIAVSYDSTAAKTRALQLAAQLSLSVVDAHCTDYPLLLIYSEDRLQINSVGKHAPGPVMVDFMAGKLAHRYQYGGGKGQLIARAVGLKAAKKPLRILDTTAGLGQDAFVLASLGCSVLMLERSPIIAALLNDGLQRAQHNTWFAQLDLKLQAVDAIDYLQVARDFDVIYIDPMFPTRNQSQLVKKEMRVVRQLVGGDLDVAALLQLARQQSAKRVVIKRSKSAAVIDGQHRVGHVVGKSTRYDIY